LIRGAGGRYSRCKRPDIDELEYVTEQKILEALGDPDSGLELKPDLKQELKRRLENPSRRIPHHEVVSRIGRNKAW